MRITKKIFNDLAIWMIGFGIIIGVVFPFFTRIFGVKPEIAYSLGFFSACIGAGILVGAVNVILSRVVIAKKLRLMISRMHMVQDNLMKITKGGDLDECLHPYLLRGPCRTIQKCLQASSNLNH
jgi:two-component system cell cycle response regulator